MKMVSELPANSGCNLKTFFLGRCVMEQKKRLLMGLLMITLGIFLVTSAAEVMAGGPNPGVPAGWKATGPGLKGVLIVGWKYEYAEENSDYGCIETFLFVDEKVYAGVLKVDVPESVFLAAQAVDVTGYEFPEQIAIDYSMPPLTIVKVLELKDVTKFYLHSDIGSYLLQGAAVSFKHIFNCEVKISFLVPSTKK